MLEHRGINRLHQLLISRPDRRLEITRQLRFGTNLHEIDRHATVRANKLILLFRQLRTAQLQLQGMACGLVGFGLHRVGQSRLGIFRHLAKRARE